MDARVDNFREGKIVGCKENILNVVAVKIQFGGVDIVENVVQCFPCDTVVNLNVI